MRACTRVEKPREGRAAGVVVSIEPEAPTTELSVEDDDVPRLEQGKSM